MFKKTPLIVIFGRTNVGKSTLFNCLREKKQALVSPIEGTTRDSNIGLVSWRGHELKFVDTGGIMDLKFLAGSTKKTSDIEEKVQIQAREFLKQADLILFVVDAKAGLLPQDKQMAILLKKNTDTKKLMLVANKVDSQRDLPKSSEFFKLSFGDPVNISAANGSGTGDLLDLILEKINGNLESPEREEEFEETKVVVRPTLKVCIIGKPNVGKSSLLNSILGYERVIVSPVPHTTREPQDTLIKFRGQPVRIIDTAGISKKSGKSDGLEKYSTQKSLSVLNKADLALLILDINEEITHQDAKLVEEILERKKSLVIIANKWDKIEERDTKKYKNYIYGKLPFAQFVPIQFASALTGEKVRQILGTILKIHNERQLIISESQLNKFLLQIVKIHRPSKGKGVKHPHIHEFRQVAANPPKFTLRIGSKEDLHFSYVRFIENRLREKYGFLGTPITIAVTKYKNVHGSHNR